MSLTALIRQTKTAWDRADASAAAAYKAAAQAEEAVRLRDAKSKDAEFWYKRTGALLIELKQDVPRGQWIETLRKLGRTQRRANEIMRLANGKETLEQQRERSRKSSEKNRAVAEGTRKSASPDGDADTEPAPRRLSTEELWVNVFAEIAAEIVALDAHWQRDYGDWKTFKVPSEYRELARQALEAWGNITDVVCKKGGNSHGGNKTKESKGSKLHS